MVQAVRHHDSKAKIMNLTQYLKHLIALLSCGGLLFSDMALDVGKPDVQGKVTAGGYHSLAIDESGQIWGWGLNKNGQLGNGTRVRRDLPFPLKPGIGASRIIGISAGEDHSLALSEDGSVWAFGLNQDGQLGIGTKIDQSVPTEVKGLSQIIEVCGGRKHSIALKRDGSVWAWGSNECGQLGQPKLTVSLAPLEVAGLESIVSVAAGLSHSLALKKDGSVWEWGAMGHRSDGTVRIVRTPRRVQGLTAVKMIAAGGRHSLALLSDGTVWAWGNNDYGQLGDGTNESRMNPTQVKGVAHAGLISAGYDHSAVLSDDHRAWTWGDNNLGQLGNPKPEASSLPVPVVGATGPLMNVAAVRCGGYHTLFLTVENELLASGNNSFGQLGDWKFKDSTFPSLVVKQILQSKGQR
ncbi:MAG: RCC1 repeat- and reductase domain-containing protein [Holophagaceae bacterium]|nr:RCC1 repeat- and reductase domain-containing protein [Holophagaceae bacterium]